MTTEEITAARERALVPYDLARKLRDLLDKAKEAYGPDDWESDEVETKIDSLVFGDGE